MIEDKSESRRIYNSDDLDCVVVKKVLAGDVDKFEVLLRRHSINVFNIVGRRIPMGDIEIVAQDVFLAAFKSLGTYEERQPFENWLARIARRRCCDYWREQERRRKLIVEQNSDNQCKWIETAASELSAELFMMECNRKKTFDMVRESLSYLDAEDRALIESIYFEDVSLKEVASTFGWSVIKTKVKVHRVRKRLRTILNNLFGGKTEHEDR